MATGDFRDELHDKADPDPVARSYGQRQFEALVRGRFRVSVQASKTHYSTPRAVLAPGEYVAFEVAVFDATNPEEWTWIIPPEDERFKAFPWAADFEPGPINSVAGYVPIATVRQILVDVAALDAKEPLAKAGR